MLRLTDVPAWAKSRWRHRGLDRRTIAALYCDVDRLLEAIRLTQEYAQLPALDGWTWFDTYRRYRPADAERLRREWQAHRDARERAAAEKHAEHPHGTLVEQTHRVMTTDQGGDPWIVAEAIVDVITRRVRENPTRV